MNYSKQREQILKAVKENAVHPTAETVYRIIDGQKPGRMGIATVYRNLKILAGLGQIKRIASDGGDRYDGNTSDHQHFICKDCGGVFDVSIFDTKNACRLAHRVDDLQITAYGVCEGCLDKKG